jgi:ABC-2 type transport system permease protein
MLQNLRIEWMKIKNYRVFQVFSALYLVGILAIIYIFYKLYINFMGRIGSSMSGREVEGTDIFNFFGSENIWNTVCFGTSFLLYLPGMIIINLFINEVNFKTHRQNIIDGWKRETFIYSKIGLIVCISAVVTLMNFLAVLIMAGITETKLDFSGTIVLLYSFIQTFIYLMFALTLATLFRRSGVAIIIFFVYGLILEFLFMWIFSQIVPGSSHFLPLQIADSLTPIPGTNGEIGGIYSNFPGQTVIVAGALAFAVLFVFLAVRKYKTDDL